MLLMGCLGCDGLYEVGLRRCPSCGTVSPAHVEGSVMPKSTSGGASNVGDVTALANEVPEDVPEALPVEEAPTFGETHVGLAEVESPGPADQADAEHVSADDAAAGYTDLSFGELRAEAKARGLPTNGSARDLAARLADHDVAVSDEGSAAVG